jgi:hypothetical protein
MNLSHYRSGRHQKHSDKTDHVRLNNISSRDNLKQKKEEPMNRLNLRTAAAEQPAAAATPPPPAADGKPLALGTVVSALPAGCSPVEISGTQYYQCGADYYRAAFQGNNLVYVTAKP